MLDLKVFVGHGLTCMQDPKGREMPSCFEVAQI